MSAEKLSQDMKREVLIAKLQGRGIGNICKESNSFSEKSRPTISQLQVVCRFYKLSQPKLHEQLFELLAEVSFIKQTRNYTDSLNNYICTEWNRDALQHHRKDNLRSAKGHSNARLGQYRHRRKRKAMNQRINESTAAYKHTKGDIA